MIFRHRYALFYCIRRHIIEYWKFSCFRILISSDKNDLICQSQLLYWSNKICHLNVHLKHKLCLFLPYIYFLLESPRNFLRTFSLQIEDNLLLILLVFYEFVGKYAGNLYFPFLFYLDLMFKEVMKSADISNNNCSLIWLL